MIANFLPNFTFHDVSINTIVSRTSKPLKLNFTFHDVSINTESGEIRLCQHQSLHSTMFLLILHFAGPSSFFISFTFHDVSINTADKIDVILFWRTLHSTMFLLIQKRSALTLFRSVLYIPRCFY